MDIPLHHKYNKYPQSFLFYCNKKSTYVNHKCFFQSSGKLGRTRNPQLGNFIKNLLLVGGQMNQDSIRRPLTFFRNEE